MILPSGLDSADVQLETFRALDILWACVEGCLCCWPQLKNAKWVCSLYNVGTNYLCSDNYWENLAFSIDSHWRFVGFVIIKYMGDSWSVRLGESEGFL
jgi:hypothetical protein